MLFDINVAVKCFELESLAAFTDANGGVFIEFIHRARPRLSGRFYGLHGQNFGVGEVGVKLALERFELDVGG